MAQTYKNIPVKPDVYARLKLVADANNRGLGDQVAAFVEEIRLPDCGHEKVSVSVQTFPDMAGVTVLAFQRAYYCPTCRRVYAQVAEKVPADE